MGSTVVLTGIAAVLGIHLQGYGIAHFNHPSGHLTNMTDFLTGKFYCILYFKLSFRSGNHTDVCILTTHGRVEGGLLHDNGSHLTIRQGFHQLCFGGQYTYSGVMHQSVIAYEYGSDGRVNGLVYGHISPHVIRYLTGLSCRLSLIQHSFLKAFLIQSHSTFFQNLPC